jgi:aldehyde dehydrogenase (NAD+)
METQAEYKNKYIPTENVTMPNRELDIFNKQKQNQLSVKVSTARERVKKLKKLKAVIQQNENLVLDALKADLRKNSFEGSAFELYTVYSEIDFAIKNLSVWMEPVRVPSNLVNILTKSYIHYEAKGICLIIAPWNYPFLLLISPLVSAIAAGNCCILKPSELAPVTSAVILKLITDVFQENEIAVIEGDASVSTALLALPFNHIFFTGSTRIGKVVMTAAAKHLATVTLELGGKSPTIVDTKADFKKVANKIVWGKFSNAGQTCIAPDYVFVHESQAEKLIVYLKEAIEQFYYKNNTLNTDDYCKIISSNHYNRLKGLLDDAVKKGAQIKAGGQFDDTNHTIHPTIITNVNDESLVMQEEIFGPLLPIITYKDKNEAINYINAHDKPLAMYVFSKSNRTINHIIKNTSAGGTCVNDVLIHISNPNLSFGGVNTSGMGGSHGFHGFKSFSHERSIMNQSKWFDLGSIGYPPYKGKQLILKILRKIM